MMVQRRSFDKMVRRIHGQKFDRVQGKYRKAGDAAARNAYAAERIKALTALGFAPADAPLIGNDGRAYGDYYEAVKG